MEDTAFIFSVTDFTFNIVGALLFVTDVTLDIWAVVTFYEEQAYVSMGVLVFLLLGSSTLLQVFSWLWYSYSSEQERDSLKKHVYLEKYLNNRCLLAVLHWCHLGVLFRFAGVMEISLRSLLGQRSKRSEGKPSEVSESLEEGTPFVEQKPLDAGKSLEENKVLEEDIHSDMTDSKPLEVDKLLIERKPLEVSKPTEKNESLENNKFFQTDDPSKDKRALEEDACGKQRQLENNALPIGTPKEQNKPLEGAKPSEKDKEEEGGIAVFMTHDLRMLRLFEAFTENTPQLTLMLTVIAQRENVEWVTGLKALGSFAAIAFSLLTYHRSMRAFTKGKEQLTKTSSFIFFLWNLLLLIPRVLAVALSASTLPLGMIAVHFLCVWFIQLLSLWCQKTDFMEHKVWEWLYRATIALILYFSWFNVSDGRARERSITYHSFMALDITLLLVLWWRYMECDAAVFGTSVFVVFIFLGTSYTLGLLVRILYHKLFHPKKPASRSSEAHGSDNQIAPACLPASDTESVVLGMDEVDFLPKPPSPTPLPPPPKALTATERRMRKMARNIGMDEVDFLPKPPSPTPLPPPPKALTATERRMRKMARNV
ncbi:XK-related protein 8-like [Engraulis encrasicolus]|uniref:XK-related protein 8-like n=1 Tax=Engraulis encrasicolus TaxID=184585 RepID=UPI002FD3C5FC